MKHLDHGQLQAVSAQRASEVISVCAHFSFCSFLHPGSKLTGSILSNSAVVYGSDHAAVVYGSDRVVSCLFF